MTIYLASYDLINEKSGYDYKPLWDEFTRLKAQKVQYSEYLVNSSVTAQKLAEHLKTFMDKDDRIWVSSVRKNEYWYVNAIGGTNAWLEKNPPT